MPSKPVRPPFEHDQETLKALGYESVDLMLEIFASESANPVMPIVSGSELRDVLAEEMPFEAAEPSAVLDELKQKILPGFRRNGHPRFWGYVAASVDPVAAFADAIASAGNQIVTAWRSAPAAAEVERLVVRWLAEWVGFSSEGHGVLVGGGSAANLHGLASSLTAAAQKVGVSRAGVLSRATVYASKQGHFSMAKAFRLQGLPDENLRLIQLDAARRLDPEDLERSLKQDRDRGLTPACVCASAGTANTGAIDPLVEIADICARHGVWFHIDGAYGAPAATTPSYSWMRDAFARADSMSLDPHKWMFAPLDVGCVLVRDREIMHRTFSFDAEYARVQQQDPIESFAFFDYSMELSRRARALKVWMLFKTHGGRQVSDVIGHNIALREYLDGLIAENPDLEALGSGLSISCFRFRPTGWTDEDRLNQLNQRIIEKLVAEGLLYMSPTTLEGRFSLRVCIVNFRTTGDDIDLLISEVLRVGRDELDRS